MLARLFKRLREVGMYGTASAVALAVDVCLLHLLTSAANVHYLVASTISFVAGGLVLYVLSVRLVFRNRRIDNRALELSFFLGVGVIGLVINSAVIYIAVTSGHVPVLVAKLLAAGFTFTMNFILRRFLLFTAAPRPQAT